MRNAQQPNERMNKMNRRLRRSLKRTGDAIVGALAIGLLRLLRLLPYDATANAAGALTRTIGPLLREHRIARAQLTAAFPEKSSADIERILSGVWDNLGRVGADFAHLDRLWDYDAEHPDKPSRIEFDAATLKYSAISLKEICASVLDLFEPLILQEQRHTELEIDEQINVWADETRLKQVLRNLIANALRYSPQRTPLCISATLDDLQEQVSISVIDRGYGVPLDKQDAIFERFVRLERDMQSTVRGSGLGLSITRQLIEAMSGTIHVESSGIPGEGAAFVFTLPTPTKAKVAPSIVESATNNEGVSKTV